MCREDGLELSSRFTSGAYPKVKFVGIIKEVAPVSGAATDEELGVNEFHVKYFNNNPLYLDQEKTFYSFLGNKSLFNQKLPSWNPFKLYSDFNSMGDRVKSKGVDGNMKGEGLLKGGLLIITPEEGIVFRHEEETGFCMPYEKIGEVLKEIVAKRAASASAVAAAVTSTETCGASPDAACGTK